MTANAIFVIIFIIFCAFLIGAGVFSKRWVKESTIMSWPDGKFPH